MSNDQQPLAVFEAKAVATRERLKRTFLSTLFFVILLVIHTNTNLFPTA